MRQLEFVSVSEDGAQLLLQDPQVREQFQVPVDDRLRAAARGDRSRLGQIELELDHTLRPREIQARIRAGESPEDVAAGAGAPLSRVMRFAYPVLQEREQITVEARRTRIRRSDSAQRLGDQVDDRLVRQGTDPDTASWDAYRREDGTWWVTLRWAVGETERRAQWSFDLPGRTITPADDVAAELQAEQPRRRTIAAVPFVPDDEPEDEPESAPEPTGVPAQRSRPAGVPPVERAPVEPARQRDPEATPGPIAVVGARERRRPVPPVREPAPEPPPEVQPEPPAQVHAPEPEPDADADRGKSGKGRKPKVPSWDDIVFGTRGNTHH